MISWSVPESSASSSIEALSVSISAIGSPSSTSSPSLLSHLRRVPSSIASPILGMITSGTTTPPPDKAPAVPHPPPAPRWGRLQAQDSAHKALGLLPRLPSSPAHPGNRTPYLG